MMQTCAKLCLFGFCWYCSPFRGSHSPKTPIFGGVIRFFQQIAKYWNVHIVKTTASIITKFCTVIDTTAYCPWWSKYAPNKSKMVDGHHVEKSQYFHSGMIDFDKIWHNDASWPSGPCQPIKFHEYENSRWRWWPFWEIEQEGLAVASIARVDPSCLPGMHCDHNTPACTVTCSARPHALRPQCAVNLDRNLKPKLAIMRQCTSVTDRWQTDRWTLTL